MSSRSKLLVQIALTDKGSENNEVVGRAVDNTNQCATKNVLKPSEDSGIQISFIVCIKLRFSNGCNEVGLENIIMG